MRRFSLLTIVSNSPRSRHSRGDVGDFQSAAHQKPLLFQQQAQIPSGVTAGAGLVDDDSVEETHATDGLDNRVAQVLEALPEEAAKTISAFDEPLVADDLQRADGDGAAERVAAVGGAVGAGLDGQHDVAGAEDAGDGVHAAGEGLAEEDEVGLDAGGVLVAEELAGAGDAGLDLVADEQDVVFGAQGARVGEVAGGGDDDAGFALDRLDEEGGGAGAVGVEGGGEGGDVVVWEPAFGGGAGGTDVGKVGAVVVAGFGVGGHGDCGELFGSAFSRCRGPFTAGGLCTVRPWKFSETLSTMASFSGIPLTL